MPDERTPREVEEAFVRLVDLMGRIEANAAHIASARRAMYLAYMAEGFTDAEALVLCQRLTID